MTDTRPALLLTRPKADVAAFLTALRGMVDPGIVVTSPVLRIVPTGPTRDMTGVDAVIFTSSNGVRAYDGPTDRPAFCVGRKTTEAARAKGFAAEFSGACAEALIATLTDLRPPGHLLHLRGTHARGEIADRLTRAGLQASEAVIYDQQAMPLSDEARALLNGARPVILPLFSPRSAEIVAEQADNAAPLWVVAISTATAQSAAKLAPQVLRIAENPDLAAVCRAVAALFVTPSTLEGG